MSTLSIRDLSKTYPNGVKALDQVTLELENGMFGLLGPNGAGKSSLLRTLATLQDADSGLATLDDIDILEQLLAHLAILKGITNSSERNNLVKYLLNKVNLYDKRKKSVKRFSGGMKQRVGIAQALIGNPKLIIVDEPPAGLDPGERNRFYNLLADLG